MSKLPNTGTSIFTTMSQMANEYKAFNLSQGFPNFPVDQKLKDIVTRWTQQEIHQYLPMPGYPPLLEKISQLTLDSYHRKVDPNTDILITAGATQGIFATIQALVHAQDEVIILDPSFDIYEPTVLLCQGKPIRLELYDDLRPIGRQSQQQ